VTEAASISARTRILSPPVSRFLKQILSPADSPRPDRQ
jgi:hypothetical protein